MQVYELTSLVLYQKNLYWVTQVYRCLNISILLRNGNNGLMKQRNHTCNQRRNIKRPEIHFGDNHYSLEVNQIGGKMMKRL